MFANVLVCPRIFAMRNDSMFASFQWTEKDSKMWFNPGFISGLDAVRSIVYHEMIHQYVDEFLDVVDNDHHGRIFWRNYKLFAPSGVALFERV